MIFIKMKIFSSISYSSSKAGIVGLTKWLATKYATENTNFNTISPAGVLNNQKNIYKNYSELIPKKKWPNLNKFFFRSKFFDF